MGDYKKIILFTFMILPLFTGSISAVGLQTAYGSVLEDCGDGVVNDAPNEACDDGENNGTTDCGCNDSCQFPDTNVVCNVGSGDACDLDDFCDGVGACDEDIAFQGTVCRFGSGDICDPDEECSGIPGDTCPDDGFEAPSTVCRFGSGDLCDPDEVCSGNPGDTCPDDRFEGSSTVCREGGGDICDPDEVCSGNPGEACPEDAVAEPGTPCSCSVGEGVCDENNECFVEISIDIKPGSDPNSINVKKMGLVPVAILGSDIFDVSIVDYANVEFGTGGALPIHMGLEDVNDDGFIDLVLLYVQKETGIAKGDVEACLSGETFDEQPFSGCDAIKTPGN